MEFKECFIVTISAGRVQELKKTWEDTRMKLSACSPQQMKSLLDAEKVARETYFSAAMKFDVQRINAESLRKKRVAPAELRTLESFRSATNPRKAQVAHERE